MIKVVSTILIACSALLAFAGELSATPQFPEILVYEGKRYPIQNELLRPYLTKYPDRNPVSEDGGWCSALWRGYQAEYEIVEKKIFFKRFLENGCGAVTPEQAKKLLPDGKPLLIDWVTSFLVSGYGYNEENPYSSSEHADAYEAYTVFEVENGVVNKVRHFDNKQYRTFKGQQYRAFAKTPEYEATIKKALDSNPDRSRKDHEKDIEDSIFYYTTKFLVD